MSIFSFSLYFLSWNVSSERVYLYAAASVTVSINKSAFSCDVSVGRGRFPPPSFLAVNDVGINEANGRCTPKAELPTLLKSGVLKQVRRRFMARTQIYSVVSVYLSFVRVGRYTHCARDPSAKGSRSIPFCSLTTSSAPTRTRLATFAIDSDDIAFSRFQPL